MAVYTSRAEWLEAQARDHSYKLASLTAKTTDAYFMGKFAAHAFAPDFNLEKDAISLGGVASFLGRMGQGATRGAQAVGGAARQVGGLARQAVGEVRHMGRVGGMYAQEGMARAGRLFKGQPMRAAPPAASLPRHTMIGTQALEGGPYIGNTAFGATQNVSRGAASAAKTVGGGGDDLLGRWQKSLIQNKPSGTLQQRAAVAPTAAGTGADVVGIGTAPTMMSMSPKTMVQPGGARLQEIMSARQMGSTPVEVPGMHKGLPIREAAGAVPAPSLPASKGTEAAQLEQLRSAGVGEDQLQAIQAAFGGRGLSSTSTPVTGRMLQGRGQSTMRTSLEGYGRGPGGQMIPLYQPRVHVSSDKLNAVLLDIIERSKPRGLIKSASLRATLDEDGILKVASEDSYWTSARGYCHLSFLAGVYDVDPDMAWTFAKNAGIIGGIARGVGRLFGGGARAAGQAAGGVARGAGAVRGAAQAGAGAVRGAAQTGAGAVRGAAGRVGNWWTGAGGATPGLNPFQRAAGNLKQRATSWWRGTGPGTQMELPGMESPATNPFGRAGRAIAEKAKGGWQGVKSEFRQGFAAGRNPAPKQMELPLGKAPAPTPTSAAGGAGQVAPRGAPAPQPKAAPVQGDLFSEVGSVAPPGGGGAAPPARASAAASAPAAAPAAGAPVGKGPYRTAPSPGAGDVIQAANSVGSAAPPAQPQGQVQLAQPGLVQRVGQAASETLQDMGRGAWETTKGVGRGIRNVGIAAGIGIPLGAGLAIQGAGKLVERSPNPYQYGMGAPQTWNFPQQM